MSEEQSIEMIAPAELLARAGSKKDQNCRLVQVCVSTLTDQFELTYSFDQKGALSHLRLQIPAANPCVPSIGAVFPCAFLYENEMHDLFGVQIEGMTVDFHGRLYNTTVKYAFGLTKPPAAQSNPAAAAAKG